jgi:glutamate 5-kinase
VPHGDPLEGVVVGSVGTGIGTGGATTKVAAARHAADAGAGVLLTATRQVGAALRGETVGTWFDPLVREPAL